jgi:hypothetical protein
MAPRLMRHCKDAFMSCSQIAPAPVSLERAYRSARRQLQSAANRLASWNGSPYPFASPDRSVLPFIYPSAIYDT